MVAAGGDGTINEVVNGLAGSDRHARPAADGDDERFRQRTGHPRQPAAALLGDHPRGPLPAGGPRPRQPALLHPTGGDRFRRAGGRGRGLAGEEEFRSAELHHFGREGRRAAARRCSASSSEDGADAAKARSCWSATDGTTADPSRCSSRRSSTTASSTCSCSKTSATWTSSAIIQRIFMGTHLALPDVEYFQTRRMTVRSVTDEDVPFEADGELVGLRAGDVPDRRSSSSACSPRRRGG